LHILVLGAAGMVGRKLCERLLRDGRLGKSEITKLTMHDVVEPKKPEKAGFAVETVSGDFAVPGAAEKLIAGRPDVIFHLAAIVSGEAELDFDKGYRINLDGTRMLLDAVRLAGGGYKPRVVFTSSIAVFGAPFPEAIGDEFCSPIIRVAASSTASASACRPSASGPACPTRRHRASSPTSCASRSPARTWSCRSPRTSATGTPRRAPRSASCSMPAPWISRPSARAAT
jgi:NAD(P)-dependent dehydrogenase (short-subunit alcohol dehydrogenase family)